MFKFKMQKLTYDMHRQFIMPTSFFWGGGVMMYSANIIVQYCS